MTSPRAARDDLVHRRGEAFAIDEALAAIRHDLLSHLTGIGNATHLLKRRVEGTALADPAAGAGSAPELLRMIREKIGAASEALERRLVPPAARAPAPASVDACLVGAVAACPAPAGVRVETDVAADLVVAADDVEVEVAISALLANAVEATADAGGGVVRVVARASDEGRATIAFEDHGAGLPPERASEAFRAFATTKPGHVGLGLAVARRVAQRWGGRVDIGAGQEGGARVTLELPRQRG